MNDVQSLLDDSSIQALTDGFQSVIIASIILTAVFVVAYIASQIRKHKVQNAIFEIQKDLHEMNERQKNVAPSVVNTPRSAPEPNDHAS